MVSVVKSVADTLKDAQAPTKWLQAICEGLPNAQIKLLQDAFILAEKTYPSDALTKTGEPLFTHALASATIVAELDLLPDAIAATLLFALPDFDKNWHQNLTEKLSPSVANLVESITQVSLLTELAKVNELSNPNERKRQAESMRKMLLAMANDIRVVLIKLASRTQTMHSLSKVKDKALQKQLAQETLDIFAPLANRLGVWQLKWVLEDLGFRYLDGVNYLKIAKLLDETRTDRMTYIEHILETLRQELAKANIKADITGRPKHIHSIYKKMQQKKLDFNHLYDIRAVRILVENIQDCYTALGIIHSIWQPISGEFDDYISHPKANDYRSLHTAVIGPNDKELEVQIRTFDMHEFAEFGVAAHWRYKEGGKSDSAYEEKIAWLRQLLDWRESLTEPSKDNLPSAFKTELFSDVIYVLTPQGRVLSLPNGATPIDFAYALHSDLGHRCRGAKIEGQIIPLSTPLKNGQRVEIIAVKEGAPSVNWLHDGWVKSSKAISKIRQFIRQQHGDVVRETGKQLIEKEFHRLGIQPNIQHLVETLGYSKIEDLQAALGHGELPLRAITQAAGKLKPKEIPLTEQSIVKRSQAKTNSSNILIDGVDNLMTVLAKCCKPAPPDPIAGFITKERGISIHRETCTTFKKLSEKMPEKTVFASWNTQQKGLFPIELEVMARDRNGLLRDISDIFSRNKLNVIAVQTLTRDNLATMRFTVEIKQVNDLPRVLTSLSDIKDVQTVRRI